MYQIFVFIISLALIPTLVRAALALMNGLIGFAFGFITPKNQNNNNNNNNQQNNQNDNNQQNG